MKYKQIIENAHEIARDKGFWDGERNVNEALMLVITELAESVEAHRKGKKMNLEEFDNSISKGNDFREAFEEHVEKGYEVEIADAVIRLADLYGGLDLLRKDIDDRIYQIKSNMSNFNNSNYDNYAAELLTICNQICAIAMMNSFSALNVDIRDSFASVFAKLINIGEQEGFNLSRIVIMKMNFNEGRERLHGKKY